MASAIETPPMAHHTRMRLPSERNVCLFNADTHPLRDCRPLQHRTFPETARAQDYRLHTCGCRPGRGNGPHCRSPRRIRHVYVRVNTPAAAGRIVRVFGDVIVNCALESEQKQSTCPEVADPALFRIIAKRILTKLELD